MTVGVSTVNTANAWLNVFRGGGSGVTFTAPATLFVQLHTADPGASGTTAVANASTRNALTLAAASSGAIALGTLSAFTGTATETITHISVWSASSAGTFYWSAALTASKAINSGDTLTFTTVGVSVAPLAA
jgi:hypothetical protein